MSMRKSMPNPVTTQLTQGRFDRIAALMGVPAATFVDTYAKDVHNMKLTLLKYMTALRTRQSHPALPFGIGDDPAQPKFALQTTLNGYPIIPIPLVSDNWRKQDWEDLFMTYIGRHYGKLQPTH